MDCADVKTKANYTVFAEEKEIPDVGRAVTYGIAAGGGPEELRAGDLFADRETAEKLVDLCNTHEVSPIHFWDVLEDFWGSEAF